GNKVYENSLNKKKGAGVMSITTEQTLKPKVKEFLSETIGLYINGSYVPSQSGQTFETLNPATEEVLATVSEAKEEDIDRAVDAARKAFDDGPWSQLTTAERSHLIYKF